MHDNTCPLRAKLGSSYEDFNALEHHVVKYHDTNTVIALSMLVVCGILYGVATNTFLAEFIIALHGGY